MFGPKSKNEVVRGSKSNDTFPYICPNFYHPRNAFSMGRFEHRSNEACGPIVGVIAEKTCYMTKVRNVITIYFATKTQNWEKYIYLGKFLTHKR